MHGVELAQALDMREIAVPAHPGISSAVGMLSADVRHDYVRTLIAVCQNADVDRIRSTVEGMESQGAAQLEREGFAGREVLLIRSADMRYVRQSYELSVPVKGGSLGRSDLAVIEESFHRLHESAYGYARQGEAVEFVNLRVVALGKLPPFRAGQRPRRTGKTPQAIDVRKVYFRGRAFRTPVYSRNALPEGAAIPGPAIIEQMDATIVVPPDYRAVADRTGNLFLGHSRKGEG